ncbi:Sec1-like syntaxin-binding protein [Encephalitozoon intestinalis ATCC 50506]|uniref:Sec1-like syntaxin-binding protein n=1 Tax=Encephalitozoon intestinalis (strain ATCC 50506) TaxID=876142 RepID=E0S5Q2_ENCIT|nr:Sec1-like syntaxin-binding protein [Encephalitozoon intestinalis ATCC 50506]ADM11037.2 Sec1-like syntaxin-binding protein [Encephalitozoon intestinalis ATCC 50506]UTX44686.1 syntaxin-binding protein [Encephalitozoon intestinalis]
MDILDLLKKKIIEDVFEVYPDAEWSVLVYDSYGASILKNFFVKSEFISHNIVTSQRIEEQRERVDFPVIYFVRGEESIVKMINRDFENRLYPSYAVCALEECEGLQPPIKVKKVDVDFLPFEQRVFKATAKQLYSVAKTLNTVFNVSYSGSVCRGLAEIVEKTMGSEERKGELIILDRSIDLFTPFLHFFTFRTLLEDLSVENMEEFEKKYMRDKVWESVKNAHLGEVNSILRNQAQILSKVAQRLDTKVDNKDLMKMVLEAPAAAKTKESLSKILGLAQKCYDQFDYLSRFNEIEQLLATGYDKSGSKWKMKVEDVFEYLRSSGIERSDKIRILLLLKANGYQLQDNEVNLLKGMGFEDSEIEISFENHESFVPLRGSGNHKYEVSRYEPVLGNVLRSFIGKQKGHLQINRLTSSRSHLKSLRKTHLLSVKKDISYQKLYCVYITGGITFEEIRVAYEISESLGVEIIVGSEDIITPKSYVEYLKSKCMSKS